MEDRLIKLKDDFSNVITIRNTVKNIFDILQTRIDKLKVIYLEFIKGNKNEMFVFGLDSFYFQNKLIDLEYDEMKRLFLAINNRMYCEYFKLYKIIVEYILKNISDKKIIELIKVNNFPVYKDLEPFKEYNFETILEIHVSILNILSSLTSYLSNKEIELKVYRQKKDIGLNIDNFVTSFNFNNIIIKEKITLFITYIEFFHKLHTKYLKRFSNKIQLMYTHISNDINFNEAVELNSDKRKEIIDELIGNNINKELLDELRDIIHVDSVSTDSVNSDLSSIVKNTFISSNNSVKSDSLEKKGLKNIIKQNVSKAKKIFNIFSGQNSTGSSPKVYSDEDIKTAFTEIDDCCNSLINNEGKTNNVEFKLEIPSISEDSNDNDNDNDSDNDNDIPLTVENVSTILNIENTNIEMKVAELNERVQNELKYKFEENEINKIKNIEKPETTKINELKELTELKIVTNNNKKKHKKKKH